MYIPLEPVNGSASRFLLSVDSVFFQTDNRVSHHPDQNVTIAPFDPVRTALGAPAPGKRVPAHPATALGGEFGGSDHVYGFLNGGNIRLIVLFMLSLFFCLAMFLRKHGYVESARKLHRLRR